MSESPKQPDDDQEQYRERWNKLSAGNKDIEKQQDAEMAKAKAEDPNKEPFDAAKLKILFDYTNLANLPGEHDSPAADREMEIKYYLKFPEVRTIEEFAEKMKELDAYGGN